MHTTPEDTTSQDGRSTQEETQMDESQSSERADVIEGTAEEIGTALEVAPDARVALFGTSDPVEVVEVATRVADALADVIRKKNLYAMIQERAHVRVEGWQLLGSMLGVTAVCTGTEAVDGGFRATVEARTTDGRVVGRADALCTKHEKRGPWKSADDYARLSMAQTRATSKALKGPLGFVVSLAGYQTTPAEEMTFVEPDAPTARGAAPASENDELDAKRCAAIIGGFTALKLTYQDIDLLLGSVGINGLRARSPKAIEERIVGLSTDQADVLEAELQEMADKGGDS